MIIYQSLGDRIKMTKIIPLFATAFIVLHTAVGAPIHIESGNDNHGSTTTLDTKLTSETVNGAWVIPITDREGTANNAEEHNQLSEITDVTVLPLTPFGVHGHGGATKLPPYLINVDMHEPEAQTILLDIKEDDSVLSLTSVQHTSKYYFSSSLSHVNNYVISQSSSKPDIIDYDATYNDDTLLVTKLIVQNSERTILPVYQNTVDCQGVEEQTTVSNIIDHTFDDEAENVMDVNLLKELQILLSQTLYDGEQILKKQFSMVGIAIPSVDTKVSQTFTSTLNIKELIRDWLKKLNIYKQKFDVLVINAYQMECEMPLKFKGRCKIHCTTINNKNIKYCQLLTVSNDIKSTMLKMMQLDDKFTETNVSVTVSKDIIKQIGFMFDTNSYLKLILNNLNNLLTN